MAKKNITYVTITQNPYAERVYSTTLYQFGRKDAFPGTNTLYGGNIVEKVVMTSLLPMQFKILRRFITMEIRGIRTIVTSTCGL